MMVKVTGVVVPEGSTVGFGWGNPVGDETKLVVFSGDWRPMAGLALIGAASEGEPLVVDIPDWSILEIKEL